MFAGGFLGFIFVIGAVVISLLPYVLAFGVTFFVVYTLYYVVGSGLNFLADGFNFLFGSIFTSADLLDLVFSILYIPIWLIGTVLSGIGSVLSFLLP